MSIYVGHKDISLQGIEAFFELNFRFVPSEPLIGFDKILKLGIKGKVIIIAENTDVSNIVESHIWGVMK